MLNKDEKKILLDFSNKVIKPKIEEAKNLKETVKSVVVHTIPMTKATQEIVEVAKKLEIDIKELWRYEAAYVKQPKLQEYLRTYFDNYIGVLIDIKEIIEENQ